MKTARLFTAFVTAGFAGAAHGAVDFEKQILPLLEKTCVECHKAPYEEDGKLKEPKAGLRLDAKWAILAGSENGKVLEPGDPKDSELYYRVSIPQDDDDFMPPKGEPWTKEETELVKKWIEEGADFGDWEGNLEGKPEETEKEEVHVSWVEEHYKKLAEGLEPATDEAIAKVEDAGGRVTPLASGNPLLRVDYLINRDETTDENVAAITALAENVAQVDLSRTQITGEALKYLSGLPRLTRLDLHSTQVADAGLEHLSGLENLIYLNLYDTQVSDAGLKEIAKIKSLRSVYLWKSQVTQKGVNDLEKALPDTKISWK